MCYMLGQNVPPPGLYNSPNVSVGHKEKIKTIFSLAQTGGFSKENMAVPVMTNRSIIAY